MVAAQNIELALLAVGFLQPLGHFIKCTGQMADLVVAHHRHPCAQVARCERFCSQANRGDAIGHRRSDKITQRHGNATGEDQQHTGQEQVVLAGEHQPCRKPDVEIGQQRGQGIPGKQRPGQPGRAAQPAQPVGAITGQNRNQGCDCQKASHCPQLGSRGPHHQDKGRQRQRQRYRNAGNEAQG